MTNYERAESLLVFVHIPKTAGSSVNKSLEGLGCGISHFENFLATKDRSSLRSVLAGKQWVSGHVPYPEFTKVLDELHVDSKLMFLTAIRNPLDQVRSHYNWLVEIYFKGRQFYDGHPENIKEISSVIRSSNRSSAKSLIENLEKYRGLFLNIQYACTVGSFRLLSKGDLKSWLCKNYSYVATEHSLPFMLQKIGLEPKLLERQNVSRYHFDPSVFENPEVLEFLSEHNKLDQLLYDSVAEGFECC